MINHHDLQFWRSTNETDNKKAQGNIFILYIILGPQKSQKKHIQVHHHTFIDCTILSMH